MHPFNTFPSLLYLSFFVPTILRVACAGIFALLALHHYRERKGINHLLIPLAGKMSMSIVGLLIAIEAVTASALFVGWYTQIFAICSAALATKLLVMRPKILAPYGKVAEFLLLTISITLVITGGGAFAQDIPL